MTIQRSYRLNLRLSEKEWKKAHRLYANSTCRSISEYARKLLTNEPIIQFFRNPSLEEINAHVPRLLDVMTGVAVSFAAIDLEFTQMYGNLFEIAEDIRLYLAKLSDQCDLK